MGILKQKKGLLILLAAALVCLAAFLVLPRLTQSGGGTYDELVKNGSAENGDEDWLTGAYVSTPGYSFFEVREGEGRNGSSALYIRNEELNDARFYQTLNVSPNTLYRISGYIRSDSPEGVGEDGKVSKGANLSVEGLYVFSDSVYDTNGEWQEVRLYGKTGEKQDRLTLYVRLGGYSGEALGEAWFDDISVHRVDSAEEGYPIHSFAQAESEPEEKTPSSAASGAGLVIYAILFSIFAGFVFQYLGKEKSLARKTGLWCLGAVMAAALILRLVPALLCRGYDIDVNDFRVWANTMYSAGPVRFYDAAGWCDYPPGYLMVLWVLGFLGHFSGGTSIFLVKLPSIVCDLCIILLLYREGEKRFGSVFAALCVCALYAANPLAICAGAAWGQADSLMILLLLLTVLLCMDKKWIAALPLYGLAVLVKPQSLMFGPLGLAALVLEYREVSGRQQSGERAAFIRSFLTGLGIMAGVMLAVVLPFAIGQGGLKWLFELYGNTMNGYRQAAVNACNWYFLTGANWVSVENAAGIPALLGVFMTLIVPCAVFSLRNRRPAKENAVLFGVLGGGLLLSLALAAAGELSYEGLGLLMILFSLALVMWLYIRGGSAEHLPLCGAAFLCLMFANGTMMHERYLFPAAALLLAAFIREKDRRILWLFLLLTVSCFLNVGCVLDRNLRIGGSAGHLNSPAFGLRSDLAPLEYFSAAVSVIGAGLSLYLACDRCRPDAPLMRLAGAESAGEEKKADGETWTGRAMRRLTEQKQDARLDRKDLLIALCASALFCAFTLVNLGSTKAPQTAYIFQRDESVVLDLGEEKTFDLLYYQEIHYADTPFTVETSADGETFEVRCVSGVTAGDCFKWKYLYPDTGDRFTGRYIRLTAGGTGLTLMELLARDADGNVFPMTAWDGADALCDEPDTLTGDPDWFNSCYFDEIYHARTAYELLHRRTIYEWTHPPLGKVIMSACVAVFGMTPFGWRFAGAMMGVLMLPAIYLLARELFRKRMFALGALGLLALDFMHYTQTRIATIDSFVVCFILWSFCFMIRWFRRDFWSRPLAASLGDLAASGFFMGLAVASKWTGCYAGVGLAVLFFWGLTRRILEAAAAEKAPREAVSGRCAAARNGRQRLLITVGSCFGFFIFVPLLIYYLSYIPFLRANGTLTGSLTENVRAIIAQAQGMLSYHGTPGLGMDHFFYTPWYEWPFIIKPMWYSSTTYAPEGYSRTILAFGNPAVWYMGVLGTLLTAVIWAARHWNRRDGITLLSSGEDPAPALLLISFLAQYLPWVLVPRGTYIYHYFPSVPFIILCNMCALSWLEKRRPKAARIILWAELDLALALFIAFFPYISGVTASKAWLDAMKWFPGWLYY